MEEYKPRNVIIVAEQIYKLIPDDKIKFKEDINKFIKNSWNQAPEALLTPYNWDKFSVIINYHINDIKEEWRKNIIDIFMNTVN